MTIKNSQKLLAGILAIVLVAGMTSPAFAVGKLATANTIIPLAVQEVTNGFITVEYEDTTGQYSFKTGALHSSPNERILFPVGTGYDSVRTSVADYTTISLFGTPLGPPDSIIIGATTIETTWNVQTSGDDLTIIQLIEITGNSEVASNVTVTTTVTNNDVSIVDVSIRHFWDYQVDGDDGPSYATKNPDGAPTTIETDFVPPTHEFAVIDDTIAHPLITSAVADRDNQSREVYGSWPAIFASPFDYTPSGINADGDSAVLFYSNVFSIPSGESATFWSALSPTEALGLDVEIDIKPGSFPNSINPRSMGVVPVAILGSATFDVLDVDVSALSFGPGAASPVHEEAGAVPADHYEDVNDDGFIDLVTHYVQKEALPDEPEACLTGALNDGTPIQGCDSVRLPGNN